VRNHTTGEMRTYEPPLRDLQRDEHGFVRKLLLWVGLLGLILGIPLIITARVLASGRRHTFIGSGLRPLDQALTRTAGELVLAARAARAAPQPTGFPAPTAPAPAPLAPPAAVPRPTSDELARLFILLERGAITPDEYEQAKRQALAGNV
jgi:hypothetical protein